MRKTKKKYPLVDLVATGENIKSLMRERGFKVKDIQDYLGLNS